MPPAATRTMASPSNEDRSDQDAFVGEWIDKYFVELDEVYRGRIVSQSAHSTNTHTNSNTDTHTSALWKVYYPADPTKSYPDSDVEELDWDEVQTGIALYRQRNGKEKENGKTKTFATRTSPRTPSSNQATSPRTFVSSATSTSISTTSASSTSSTTTTSSTTSLPKVRRTSRRRSVTQSSYRDEASVESADDETYRTARRSPRTRTSPPRALDAQLAVEPPSKRSRTAVSRSTTRRSSPTSSRSTALPCAFAVLMGARPAPRKARTAKDSVANAPSHHPSSAPEHGPLPVPPTRTQTQTPTTSHAVEGNPMADGSRFVKKPYTAGDDLPVLAQPHAMFDDLVANLTDHGRNIHVLWPLVETFRSRTLRVATMCSGTEAPVLALDLLQTSLRHALRRHAADELRTRGIDVANVLRIEHVFSCEIEPFKQAYIERNFRPPLLFRDIRELGQPQAYTAYGALRDVPNRPGCVDMLVAGTSCVDYSNLNNQKKHIDQKGESGQTFHGMMDWVDLAQPPIVIIENVSGAPWEIKVKMFEERGYAATFLRIDTKEYYIPQTRKRGYLFAIKAQTKNKVVDRPARWTAAVKSLKRPASAALDDFMLPNDDPRVLRGRARLTAESSAGEGEGRTRTVDWTKCETNHQQARSMEELGDKRPLTNWSDSGNTAMPSFGWNEWTNAQVHRIHDLMDINALRLAKLMIDCSHKTMVWNLSQNVHRDTMGVLGLSQCLTPTGVFYVANRGGPLVGEELLMLQGIPAEDLLLTKESEANLKDFAGNGMSTTVVGTVMLCALLHGHDILRGGNEREASSAVVPSLVPRSITAPSDASISLEFAHYAKEKLELGPRSSLGREDWSKLLSAASSSSKKCITEGKYESLPPGELVTCQECGFTSSKSNAVPPRKYEEHHFVPNAGSNPRVHPADLREELLKLLPMRAQAQNFDLDTLSPLDTVSKKLWQEWKVAVKATLYESDATGAIFLFKEITRTHIWTAHFGSRNGGRLEMRISKSKITWLLFAKPPSEKGELRDILSRPVARLCVRAPNDSTVPVTLLTGSWELCLPETIACTILVEGSGDTIPSWRNRLGLKGGFETERQFSRLKVTLESSVLPDLKAVIDGVYAALPQCGGACGSLRKKEKRRDTEPDLFFFLESGRKSLPGDDTYIFSPTCHRTSNGEYRETLLVVDKAADFDPLHSGVTPPLYRKIVKTFVPGRWIVLENAFLEANPPCSSRLDLTTMSSCADTQKTLRIGKGSWQAAPKILSCDIPSSDAKDIQEACQMAGGLVEVNLQKSSNVFQQLSFVLSRLKIPSLFSENCQRWLELGISDTTPLNKKVNGEIECCQRCAPQKPHVKWRHVWKGKSLKFSPIEDGQEAAVYERAVKQRPQAWLVRLETKKSHSLHLQIACNAVSLAYRAFGRFPKNSLSRDSIVGSHINEALKRCSFEWRVVAHVEKRQPIFPTLVFRSNKRDVQAEQPPTFSKYMLRKEQLRSLAWMLKQESTMEPYYEEEVTEAILPGLEWRAESRVRRPILARGGIIADEVGYGKTAITLGLIDSSQRINGDCPELPPAYRDRLIQTKATLIIVPEHLMGQWPEEVQKFLGRSKRVIEIKSMASMNKITVEDIQKADIVVASFQILSNETYFLNLAEFSGVNASALPSNKNGGRHFDSLYNDCLEGLLVRVPHLIGDTRKVFSEIRQDAECHESANAEENFRVDGKKSAYKNGSKSSKMKAPETSKIGRERDPWGLSTSKVKASYRKMSCPPLELFFWNRLVVDEFTYLEDNKRHRALSFILGVKSSYRWLLSGTPKHSNFDDIQSLSSLLGIHLGIDESLPGVKMNRSRGVVAEETTGLESLSLYLEMHSMQWHERRHVQAQSFLDQFVRQNKAEHDEIPWEEHLIFVDLPPVERAIYLELETHLKSLDMNKNAQKTKRKSTGDRDNRMQRILQDSASAEEALLKCCSHFNMSSEAATALETITDIIKLRDTQKKELERDIVVYLASAFRQQHRILQHQSDWLLVSRSEKGEVASALQQYLREVEKRDSVTHGADDEVHDCILQLVRQAEEAFHADPSRIDSFFDVDEGDDPQEGSSPKRRRGASPQKSKKEAAEKFTERLFAMKIQLRDHLHLVRSMGKELCGRVRSLRYVQWIRKFQDASIRFTCGHCRATGLESDQVGVLSSCGHVGCLECLRVESAAEKCVEYPSCRARVSSAHVVSSRHLGLHRADSSGGRYGRKLTVLVEKVREIIAMGDRMIVFCQFDDLKEKIRQVLLENGVPSLEVAGSVHRQIASLRVFQKEIPGPTDPRVLVLKMDDEQSAGLNLTHLNHALFVHPLLALSRAEYDAYETQAIGRIRRFGQTKTVHLHRFLARNTMDMEIWEERTKPRA